MSSLQVVHLAGDHKYEIIDCDGVFDTLYEGRADLERSVQESVSGKKDKTNSAVVFFARKDEKGKLRCQNVGEDTDEVFKSLRSIADRLPPLRVVICFRTVKMDDSFDRLLEDLDDTMQLNVNPSYVASFMTNSGEKVLFRTFDKDEDVSSDEDE